MDFPNSTFCLPRVNTDNEQNRFGLSLIELCCTKDSHLLNSRFSDVNETHTCVANNGRSVVDYIVASSSLFDVILDFYIDDLDCSDHFPLVCNVKTNIEQITEVDHIEADLKPHNPCKWNETLRETFVQNFSDLYNTFVDSIDEDNIAESESRFVELFSEAEKCMRSKRSRTTRTATRSQPDW